MSTGQVVREALLDGRRVAMLRCYDGADGVTIVEAEVLPLGATEAVGRGPYRFANAYEAFRFLQEATLALQYLGCSISSS